MNESYTIVLGTTISILLMFIIELLWWFVCGYTFLKWQWKKEEVVIEQPLTNQYSKESSNLSNWENAVFDE